MDAGIVIIGIAGGIGAGKSVVSRIVRCNGFPVYDCDMEASRLMNCDCDVKRKLKCVLGEDCFLMNGKLDRQKVSARIFNEESMREKVNKIVHSAIVEDFRKFCEGKQGPVYVESAIMVTSGLDKMCTSIWLVEAPENLRIERVMKRSGLTEKEVIARIETQRKELSMLPAEKTVIMENDDCSELLLQVVTHLHAGTEACILPLTFPERI